MTCEQPASRTMKAATSPVNAPSLCSVAQSCADTRIFDPSRRTATDFKAVKTGAITTSQWLAFATRGLSATAVATESATVLYIFQFPVMTGLRIRSSYFVLGVLYFVLLGKSRLLIRRQRSKHKVR